MIEEKTGMDFERFTRSVLLAQGGFDTFLRADPDQRAPILEQITGTEIYSDISKGVHERHRREKEALQLLNAEIAGVRILTQGQEGELSTQMSEMEKSETAMAAKHQKTWRSIEWLKGMASLGDEIEAISKESQDLREEMEAFVPERERLRLAQRAAELEGQWVLVSSGRAAQRGDLESLEKEETQLPKATLWLTRKTEAEEKAVSATLQARMDQKAEAEVIKQVRALDLQINEQRKALKAAEADCGKISGELSGKKKKRQTASEHESRALGELKRIQQYLTANAKDEWLVAQLAGIKEKVNHLKSAAHDISERKRLITGQEKEAKKSAREHLKHQALLARRNKESETWQHRVLDAKKRLGNHLGRRMLREYRNERDTLYREMAFRKRIFSLEAERKQLEDGKQCPLCGAREHPFAKGNVPKMDEIQKRITRLSTFIERADGLEDEIKGLEREQTKIVSLLSNVEKSADQALHLKEASEKDLQRLMGDLAVATDRFNNLKDATLSDVKPFDINEWPDGDISAILPLLNERVERWESHQRKKARIEERKRDLSSEIRVLNDLIETLSRTLREKQDMADRLKRDYEQRLADRRGIYGSKIPDEEEAAAESRVSEAENREKRAGDARHQAKEQLNAIKTRINTLKENISRRESDLEAAEKTFRDACIGAGFGDEREFMDCRLSAEQRNRLEQRARELDEQRADIFTRKKDREDRLAREREKDVTETPLDVLNQEKKAQDESLKKIAQEIGGIKQKLSENNAAKARIREKRRLIEAQEKEVLKWGKLHELIGSADGKKYRNFAQGLTFQLMVSHANGQLHKMTDRYLLVRDDSRPLELNVIDNYQAGEQRSTKNLSGGESFIVSLALALGLSKMASRRVRVDSLFLDEGFGTLDEEALETALETLAGLRQDGKLIGIISHVPALRERISTRIDVVPVSGGKSAFTGPGCKMI